MRGATQAYQSILRGSQISIHAPHAGSDLYLITVFVLLTHFNPRPPCGERLITNLVKNLEEVISIHAPHAGSDRQEKYNTCYEQDFNPRPPCGERRQPIAVRAQKQCHFNPRPPCGERHLLVKYVTGMVEFQSTPPMRGATQVTIKDF